MGLLNKLKNVLFEEEIEEIKEEETPVKPKVEAAKPVKEEKEKKETSYNFEEETDRELFKAEKTFDFPAFDEEEFEDFAPKEKEKPVVEKEEPKKRTNNTYTRHGRKKEYTATRIVKEEEEPKKVFKPSPVMSPVYGILDKNYKKEDVVTKEEAVVKSHTKLDVDSVRKKAFGTLEEDLEKTLNEPLDTFYEEKEENKESLAIENLDHLLEDTVDIEIDVTKEMEIPTRTSKKDEEEEHVETLEKEPEEIKEDVINEPVVEEVEEQVKKEEVSDDTLENDLFELIDSMYENREDEE